MFVFVVPAPAPRVSFQMRSRSGRPRTLPAAKRAPEQKRKPFQADAVSTRRRFDFEVFGHEALTCLFFWCPRLPPGSPLKCARTHVARSRRAPRPAALRPRAPAAAEARRVRTCSVHS